MTQKPLDPPPAPSVLKKPSRLILGRRYARSSSFQMALLFTILCSLAVLVMGYFSYYFARGHYIYGTEAVIDTEINYIKMLDRQSFGNFRLAWLPPNPQRLYVFFGPGSMPPPIKPDTISILSEGIILFEHAKNGKPYAAKILTLVRGQKLLVAVDMSEVTDLYRFMLLLSSISIVIMLLIVAVSYLISTFVVSNTNKIALTAMDIIETGDLSRRVHVSNRWDDLSYIAHVFNILLERMEQLVTGVKQVSDNIAHDLRTPLTRLRTNLEAFLNSQEIKKGSKNTKACDMCDDLLSEADHLLDTFNAILRISRIETEQQKKNFNSLDLHTLIEDVIEFYEPLAEENDIKLDISLDHIQYYGDRDLMFQMFANLFDNALKFTPNGGTIRIELKKENETLSTFIIQDNGPGVPQGDETKIFQRFYRTEKCRNTPGSGLGLSLVSAIANLHKATITAENADPGLAVTITLINNKNK